MTFQMQREGLDPEIIRKAVRSIVSGNETVVVLPTRNTDHTHYRLTVSAKQLHFKGFIDTGHPLGAIDYTYQLVGAPGLFILGSKASALDEKRFKQVLATVVEHIRNHKAETRMKLNAA